MSTFKMDCKCAKNVVFAPVAIGNKIVCIRHKIKSHLAASHRHDRNFEKRRASADTASKLHQRFYGTALDVTDDNVRDSSYVYQAVGTDPATRPASFRDEDTLMFTVCSNLTTDFTDASCSPIQIHLPNRSGGSKPVKPKKAPANKGPLTPPTPADIGPHYTFSAQPVHDNRAPAADQAMPADDRMLLDQNMFAFDMPLNRSISNAGMQQEQNDLDFGLPLNQNASNVGMPQNQNAFNAEMPLNQNAFGCGMPLAQGANNVEMSLDQNASYFSMPLDQNVTDTPRAFQPNPNVPAMPSMDEFMQFWQDSMERDIAMQRGPPSASVNLPGTVNPQNLLLNKDADV